MKRIMFIVFVLISSSMHANEVVKLFHHRMNENKEHIPSLEIAKLTFYFTHEPQLRKSEPIVTKNGWHEVTFSFAGVKSSNAEVIAMMQKFNESKTTNYALAITSDPSGVQLKISYNPHKITIRTRSTIAIKQEKVIEIVLYDKNLEQILNEKKNPVLRYTQSRKPTIVIDCGHGGHDKGTVGYFKTVEKDVTLAIGLKLKKELEKNYQVLLTRLDDRFVALDERTSLANRCAGNTLLISLHANNAAKNTVSGLETYCLGPELFKPLDYQLATSLDIAIDKAERTRFKQGAQLAQAVHDNILKSALQQGYTIADRHVKKATAQILSGLVFPGILVEMGYLSHEESARLLTDPVYQDTVIVPGICNGIRAYHKQYNNA